METSNTIVGLYKSIHQIFIELSLQCIFQLSAKTDLELIEVSQPEVRKLIAFVRTHSCIYKIYSMHECVTAINHFKINI